MAASKSTTTANLRTPREASKAKSRTRVAKAAPRVSPDRVAYLIDAFGQTQLAALAGVNRSQPGRWASGQEQPGVVAGFLLDLELALAKARLVWADPAATNWFYGNNSHLQGARPIDVLQQGGNVGAVMDALEAEQWGAFA